MSVNTIYKELRKELQVRSAGWIISIFTVVVSIAAGWIVSSAQRIGDIPGIVYATSDKVERIEESIIQLTAKIDGDVEANSKLRLDVIRLTDEVKFFKDEVKQYVTILQNR